MIVLIGLADFGDWRIPLDSWIVIFITGKVIDGVMQGINYDKTLLNISDKYDEIRDKIINDLDRGSFLSGKGMYKGLKKPLYSQWLTAGNWLYSMSSFQKQTQRPSIL